VLESVKKLHSVESKAESTETFVTGRPGMSIPSQESVAQTRVKLGRHLSSNGVKGSESAYKVMFVILGWLFRNF
jgi:hypothetical protein